MNKKKLTKLQRIFIVVFGIIIVICILTFGILDYIEPIEKKCTIKCKNKGFGVPELVYKNKCLCGNQVLFLEKSELYELKIFALNLGRYLVFAISIALVPFAALFCIRECYKKLLQRGKIIPWLKEYWPVLIGLSAIAFTVVAIFIEALK